MEVKREERNLLGLVTYREWDDGHWQSYVYDTRGNETYIENSNGYWRYKEYDECGRVTYLKDSDGYWCRSEYNKLGQKTYVEDSYGIKCGTPKAEITLRKIVKCQVSKVDCIGRVKIPKDIRKSLRIHRGDNIMIFVDDENIVLRRMEHGQE